MNKTFYYLVLDITDVPQDKIDLYEMIAEAFDVAWLNPVWVKEINMKEAKANKDKYMVLLNHVRLTTWLTDTNEWVINCDLPSDKLVQSLTLAASRIDVKSNVLV